MQRLTDRDEDSIETYQFNTLFIRASGVGFIQTSGLDYNDCHSILVDHSLHLQEVTNTQINP